MLIQPHQQKIKEVIQLVSPKIYDWCQAKASQLQQEQTDQAAEQLKKSLKDQK